MKAKSHEEIIDLSDLLTPVAPTRPSTSPSAGNGQKAALRALAGARPERKSLLLHEELQHLSGELRHLLRYLEMIHSDIMQEGEGQKMLLLFRLIHDRALLLIGRMNALASRVEDTDANLRDTLGATGFALSHEIRRVYEVEAPGLNKPENTSFSRSALMRAYGLLRNCFQQSAISLAQVSNSSADAEAILKDYKERKEQSLALQRELSLLLQKAQRLEKEAGALQILNFINVLERFRGEVMHFLMYRDWEEFENFVDEIVKTYDETGRLDTVLHQFVCYLETLQKHVSMRSVLINHQSGLS